MNKQISHDELRTRLIAAGATDLDTLEMKVSCYPDCHCDKAMTENVINLLQGALDYFGDDPEWADWTRMSTAMITLLKERTPHE